MKNVDEFWQDFLQQTNRGADTPYLEAFYFGSNEASAEGLLQLVLSGKKTATCSSRILYEKLGEEVPRPGSLSIVTDWAGVPYCVIETTNVLEMRFREMTYEICHREGEDADLASWRKNHIEFFSWEGAKFGYEFSEELPIVFEDFEVVYRGQQT